MTIRNLLLALLAIWLSIGLYGCAGAALAQPVFPAATPIQMNVFAAASLTEAFGDLARQFEANEPGVQVVLNFAGSQQLAQQLAQGAPADVFASANRGQMQVAVDAGRVVPGRVMDMAHNRLVVITPEANPGGIHRLQDLARPGLKIVIAAEAVPVGRYALTFLGKSAQDPDFGPDFEPHVLENVVSYEQTVKAVLSKVLLGEADAGVVYTSDLTPANRDQLLVFEIPPDLNVTATYTIAPVADSARPALAERFIQFVLSPAGQAILVDHGLVSIQE